MTSAAQDYGLPNGDALSRSIQGPFADAHNGFSGTARSHSRQAEETATAVQTGNLDTLDMNPPTPEEMLLQKIQALLDSGEFEQAARHLQTVLDRKSEFDFTPAQNERLHDLIEQTQHMAAENFSPTEDAAAMLQDILDEIKKRQRETQPGQDLNDMVTSLTFGEGSLTIAVGLGLF